MAVIAQCLVDVKKGKTHFLKPKLDACDFYDLYNNMGLDNMGLDVDSLFEVPFTADRVWITLYDQMGYPKNQRHRASLKTHRDGYPILLFTKNRDMNNGHWDEWLNRLLGRTKSRTVYVQVEYEDCNVCCKKFC